MTAITIMTAIVCLLLGIALGSLLTRSLSPQEKKQRELEAELRRAEDQLRLYQRDVAEHFTETANLIGNLSRSYREVHEHLAAGAMTLAAPDISRQVQDAASSALERPHSGITLPGAAPEPPKDYAPSVPGGVLSENYGFGDMRDKAANPMARVANDGDAGPDDDPTLKVS